ncbi:MAG TPA: hypothetical protein VHX43_08660 [Xanthobacteraceae bacterium]|jgi:hypothetical protein|nr:hypothetical protein [Xanthobacteraceae bacterium]
MRQSQSTIEYFLREAKQQVSQRDVNESLIRAINELIREVKRIDDTVQRARRDIQISRRF